MWWTKFQDGLQDSRPLLSGYTLHNPLPLDVSGTCEYDGYPSRDYILLHGRQGFAKKVRPPNQLTLR